MIDTGFSWVCEYFSAAFVNTLGCHVFPSCSCEMVETDEKRSKEKTRKEKKRKEKKRTKMRKSEKAKKRKNGMRK